MISSLFLQVRNRVGLGYLLGGVGQLGFLQRLCFSDCGGCEHFSPQGTVKQVRQVHVGFSDPIVPFGDLQHSTEPFDVQCNAKWTYPWLDSTQNRVYDFDRMFPPALLPSLP